MRMLYMGISVRLYFAYRDPLAKLAILKYVQNILKVRYISICICILFVAHKVCDIYRGVFSGMAIRTQWFIACIASEVVYVSYICTVLALIICVSEKKNFFETANYKNSTSENLNSANY